MELAVLEGARAQTLALGHAPARRRVLPPDGGAHDAVAGLVINEEQAHEVVAQRLVAQAVHDAVTDLLFVEGRGDLGAQPQEGRLPPGQALIGPGMGGAHNLNKLYREWSRHNRRG